MTNRHKNKSLAVEMAEQEPLPLTEEEKKMLQLQAVAKARRDKLAMAHFMSGRAVTGGVGESSDPSLTRPLSLL